MIGENETMDSYDLYDPYGDDQSERGDVDLDFLEVELVRSTFTTVVAKSKNHILYKQSSGASPAPLINPPLVCLQVKATVSSPWQTRLSTTWTTMRCFCAT